MKSKVSVFVFLVFLTGLMIMPIASIFAEDVCQPPEEFEYMVTLVVHYKNGSTSGDVQLRVWATKPSEAEERAKQQFRDNNPRIVPEIVSIAATKVVKL